MVTPEAGRPPPPPPPLETPLYITKSVYFFTVEPFSVARLKYIKISFQKIPNLSSQFPIFEFQLVPYNSGRQLPICGPVPVRGEFVTGPILFQVKYFEMYL